MHATRVGSHAHRPLESGPRAIPLTQRAGSHPGHGRCGIVFPGTAHSCATSDANANLRPGMYRDVFSEAVLRFTCVGISVCCGPSVSAAGTFLENPLETREESLPSGNNCDVVCGGMHHRCGCHGFRGPARQASASSGHQGASSGHQVGVSGHQAGVQDSGCGRPRFNESVH